MKVKLLKSVLVGDADVIATPRGEVVDVPDEQAKEFISTGLAEEYAAKSAPAPLNKMADAVQNKAVKAK
jgi:hypothetical protein